jgi:hypothetical protein
MEVYINACGNGWIILNGLGQRMCGIVWRKYHLAEDFCVDKGWIICEYAQD